MYCHRCDYPLDPAHSGRCPECGRPFDPRDPSTTRQHSLARLRARVSRGLFNLLLVVIAAGTAGAFILSLTGSDPLLVFLGGFALLPFLLLLWVLAALPWTPIRPRTRIIAMLLPILLASIVLGNWPFHLSFRVHRSGLETLASRIRNGEDVEDRPRVGLLRFEQARITDDGTVGLQLTGGPGGGVYLVRQASGSGWVWFNTNWETDLGDGWYLVYQD